MSYINDALKKAQREKDHRYSSYRKLLSGNSSLRLNTKSRSRWIIGGVILCVLIISTALCFVFLGNAPQAGKAQAPLPQAKKPAAAEPQRPSGGQIQSLYRSALSYQLSKDLAWAESLYRQILDADPRHGDSLNNLGVICLSRGTEAEAESLFIRAVESKPDSPEAFYNLACLYARRGETAKALENFRSAYRLSPEALQWAQTDEDLKNFRSSPGFKKNFDKGR